MMKTFSVEVYIETDEDDGWTEKVVEETIYKALLAMPESPYIEFSDLRVTEEEV